MSNRAWHSRPSLISCWEHEASWADLTGDDIININSIFISSPFSLAFIVPRACRMTRVSIYFTYLTTTGTGLDFEISKSTDCGLNWTVIDTTSFDEGPGGLGQGGCTCYDVSIPFDQCDLWRVKIINPGFLFTFPAGRAVMHFELR